MTSSAHPIEDTLLRGVERALERAAIAQGDTLLLAWSGGRDSTVLLDLLEQLAQAIGFKLVALHVDHRMRASSAHDAEHCAEEATRRGLHLEICKLDAGQASSQADARAARYQALAHTARDLNACAVITAHHGDDRLESALLNLLRGCGLDGLATLREDSFLNIVGENLRILRPMLFASAAEVGDYAKARGLSWVEDPTNATDRYLRNRLRQRVTPALREIAGELGPARRTLENLESEQRAAELAADALFHRATRHALTPAAHAFDVCTLLRAPQATVARLLLKIAPHFDRATLDRIIALLPDAFTISPKHLAVSGYLVTVSHARLTLEPSQARGGRDLLQRQAPHLPIPKAERGTLDWQGSTLSWSTLPTEDLATDHPARRWRRLIPSSIAARGLCLRGPRPGDLFASPIQGADGEISPLKAATLFQHARLGTDVRWCWPCIADADDHLIWIAGIEAPSPPRLNEKNDTQIELIVRPSAALSAILQWEWK